MFLEEENSGHAEGNPRDQCQKKVFHYCNRTLPGKCRMCSCDISTTRSVPEDNHSGYGSLEGEAGAEPLGRLSGICKTFWETHFFRGKPRVPASFPQMS